MSRLVVFLLLSFSLPCAAQWHSGIIYDNGLGPKPIPKYLKFGFRVMKPLNPGLLAYVGIAYKNLNAELTPTVDGTDLISYIHDQYPDAYWGLKATRKNKLFLNYLTIPVGLEYKLTSFLRVQYTLDTNLGIGSHQQQDQDVLQYGKGAVSKFMFNHSAQLMWHLEAGSIYLGASFGQTIIRTDLRYNYDYMYKLQSALNNATVIYLGITVDYEMLKKKKVL